MTSTTNVAVPLLDLKAQYETIRSEIEPAVQEVLESQVFIGGPKVAEFECRCAGYLNVPFTVGNSSGSDALILALDALGIGPGDEVILPTYTFFSTAGSVSRVGATPVFVDIDPTTYQIDPDSIRRVLEGRTPGAVKALMPVHLFGQAADLDAVMAIAEEHGLRVIEDAAQAFSRGTSSTRRPTRRRPTSRTRGIRRCPTMSMKPLPRHARPTRRCSSSTMILESKARAGPRPSRCTTWSPRWCVGVCQLTVSACRRTFRSAPPAVPMARRITTHGSPTTLRAEARHPSRSALCRTTSSATASWVYRFTSP
ncbi:MAG: aminotransferase class I/II-fold pyridoxal phosphate-dependent enzyme, partial [Planctomycetia bacterium]|nr:aminotransferase class I/II-fold pyridoxal phosphate-dependent enzyme [Planctomycetia bacterium]